jgi:chromate reductase
VEQLQIVIIVGSLRSASVNRASARAAMALLPDDVDAAIHPIADLPLYNGDVEAQGLPESVAKLHEVAARSDGLLFFTPEYNSSFPAVTKNVIDWLSREPKGWTGKAVSAVATSPGRRAGAGVLAHFEQSLSHLPVRLFEELLGIGSYRDMLDESGELADEATRTEIRHFLARFADFARSTPERSESERT